MNPPLTLSREAPAASREALPRATKRHRAGTHRLVPPEETVARLRPFLPVMGITRVANVTGLDTIGIPVVMVCRPNAASLSVAQGKGLDLEAARASGLMESIEMFHAETITLPLKLASYQELCFTHPLIDLARLPRTAGNPFDPARRFLWIEGRNLLGPGDASCWLPYELVHAEYTLPLPPGSGAFFMSSSGLASGNHLLEALVHAICELVEHDATTLWHCLPAAARARTRLDLASVDDPACAELLERYRRAGVAAKVWETTSDLGIPAFLCAIRERSPDPLRPTPAAGGMGCHPTREVALLRALTEAAQSRLTMIAGARDDIRPSVYKGTARPEVLAEAAARAEDPAPRRFGDVPSYVHDSFEEDVAWLLGRLADRGLNEVVAVDLTRREFRIPVVRVVVPGLEGMHDAPGYVPGERARRRLEERREGPS